MHSTLDLLRPRSWTVRVRSAVASTVVVAVCLVIAGGALLGVLYNSLENSARSAAAARGLQVAEQLESDTAAQIDDSLLATDGQIGIIQVIDGSGTVRAQSRGDGAPPVRPTRLPRPLPVIWAECPTVRTASSGLPHREPHRPPGRRR